MLAGTCKHISMNGEISDWNIAAAVNSSSVYCVVNAALSPTKYNVRSLWVLSVALYISAIGSQGALQ